MGGKVDVAEANTLIWIDLVRQSDKKNGPTKGLI